MSPHIEIQWLGVRKDSGRGAVWGWFTLAGSPTEPRRGYRSDDSTEHRCYYIAGKIGKRPQVIEAELTDDFLDFAESMKKNYRTVLYVKKLTSKWGKSFDEEISMTVLLSKLS